MSKDFYKSDFELGLENDSGYYLHCFKDNGLKLPITGGALLLSNNAKTGLKKDEKVVVSGLNVKEVSIKGGELDLYSQWGDDLCGCYVKIEKDMLVRRYGIARGLLGFDLSSSEFDKLELFMSRREKRLPASILYKRKKMGWILQILGCEYFFPNGESYLFYFKGIRQTRYRYMMVRISESLYHLNELVNSITVGKLDLVKDKEWLRRQIKFDEMCLRLSINYLLSFIKLKFKVKHRGFGDFLYFVYLKMYLVLLIQPVLRKVDLLLKSLDKSSLELGELNLMVDNVSFELNRLSLDFSFFTGLRFKYLKTAEDVRLSRNRLPVVSRRGVVNSVWLSNLEDVKFRIKEKKQIKKTKK